MEYGTSGALKAQIKGSGLRFKKSLGQNFIVNSYYLDKIADTLPRDSNVMEIGTGFGALTRLLVGRGNSVISFEIDRGVYETARLGSWPDSAVLINDDCRNYGKYLDNHPYTVVSALPYSTYRKILLFLWEDLQRFPDFYLILQHEVVDNLAEKSGRNISPLSVLTNHLFDIRPLFSVPSSAFYPKPGVESFYLELSVKKNRPIENVRRLYGSLQRVFAGRRKRIVGMDKRVDELGTSQIIDLVKSLV